MSLYDILRNRRSIRRYTGEAIREEDLQKILNAGLLAPSSRNIRSAELIAVRDRGTLEALSRCKSAGASMLSGADAAVVVLGDTSRSDVWTEDAAIAMTCMHLQAAELGIGSCWIQCRLRQGEDGPCGDAVRRLLAVPEHYAVEAILSLGIPAETPSPSPDPDPRDPRLHRGSFS